MAYPTLFSSLFTFICILQLCGATEGRPRGVCKEKVKLHLKGACFGKRQIFYSEFLEDYCCRVLCHWLDLGGKEIRAATL